MKNRYINVCFGLSLSVAYSLLTLFVLEVGTRFFKNVEFSFKNFLGENRNLLVSAYPTEFDKNLGWIPKEGTHPDNVWNTSVTILKDGIRSNGENEYPNSKKKVVLAVGDSFTFGDQVSNNETWPALLEKMSSMRVINGGVFGYGIDQTYLRMKDLVPKYKPHIIIFSFIPDDINRCELSQRTSISKPYYNLSESGGLVLMKEHVIPPPPSANKLDYFRKILGYSFFAHKVMCKLLPEYWLTGTWRSEKIHSNGSEVTCRIFKKLKKYSIDKKISIYILVQCGTDRSKEVYKSVDNTTNCIEQDVLRLVDLRHSLDKLEMENINGYKSLFNVHMTREGNHFVAKNLYKAINSDKKGMPNKTNLADLH